MTVMTTRTRTHHTQDVEPHPFVDLLHRPMMTTSIIGTAAITLGVGILLSMLASNTVTLDRVLLRFGQTCIIVGALVLVYASLRRKGRSIEEAYRLGYDVGFENGFRSGAEPVVRRSWEARENREHAAATDVHPS